MSILKSSCPEGCLSIFAEGLANVRILPSDKIAFPTLVADDPLPVHVFGADQAAVGDLEDPPGLYRFFFRIAGKAMLADLDLEPDGKLSFNSFLEGEGAELFDPVFQAVAEFAETVDDDFAISIIEVPALYEIALRLRGHKADFAFEVLRRGESGEGKAVPYIQYVAELSDDASRSYIFADDAQGPAIPENEGPGK
ncbi:hypothetical protein ELH58_10360 [Rhizobium ruizarguesonis]|uniref:hypothetical protein n=1 Tax=Rhizobium TaxID=379 RepID=UPI001030D6C6|nr:MULTISPECIES: hypothetical protein [Rhizobium]MBB4389360.1 hypothetical protein [Rhizobium leguminosarum]NKL79030.1 hypothetical protein [Rhizobium leguminosarum bv. viciae]TBA68957.1 hypothetical protein ELH58_10360 [Rhizobium ruizarguesonis]